MNAFNIIFSYASAIQEYVYASTFCAMSVFRLSSRTILLYLVSTQGWKSTDMKKIITDNITKYFILLFCDDSTNVERFLRLNVIFNNFQIQHWIWLIFIFHNNNCFCMNSAWFQSCQSDIAKYCLTTSQWMWIQFHEMKIPWHYQLMVEINVLTNDQRDQICR